MTIIFIILAFATGVQSFFYFFIFSKLAFYKTNNYLPNWLLFPPVSVIICAKNEAKNLQTYLPAVLEQKYPQFEVIVVNDDSIDNTESILNNFKKQYPHLQIVPTKGLEKTLNGKKFALTQGINTAKYEHVVLTDADCTPASNLWLQYMAQHFCKGYDIVLGYSPYFTANTFLNKCIQFETVYTAIQYLSLAAAGVPYMGVGRNIAYKKSLFLQTKPYQNNAHIASGDDDLFINKVATAENTAIEINYLAHCVSSPSTMFFEWVNQKKRHLSTGKYYKNKHKLILFFIQTSHFLFYGTFFVFICCTYSLITTLALISIITAQSLIITLILKKLQSKLTVFYYLFFNILLLFYNLLIIPFIICTKHSRTWNKPQRT